MPKTAKALIVYSSISEKDKLSNEDRVVLELEKLFYEKNFLVKTVRLLPKKPLSLKDQLKNEKSLELKQKIGQLGSFDVVVIGTPVVGSLTSAPLVNSFIRSLPKSSGQKRQVFALFSAGVIHGFELKKMESLLSMKAVKPLESESFTSMFEFDAKKLLEVKDFFNRLLEKRMFLEVK